MPWTKPEVPAPGGGAVGAGIASGGRHDHEHRTTGTDTGKPRQMTPTTQLIATVFSIVASYGAFAAWMLRHMDRQMDRRFGEVDRRFGEMDRRFDEVDRRFDGVQQQFDGVQQQFAEAKADTQRQFDEVRQQFDGVQRQFDGVQGRFDGIQGQFDGIQGQFDGVQRQFAEAKADTQRQFAEFRAEMRQGFEQAREDRLRLERKMEDRFGVYGEQIVALHQEVGRLQGVVERICEPERFTVRPAAPELSAGGEVRELRESYPVGSGGEEAGRGGDERESGGEGSTPAGEGAGQGDDP